MRIFLVGKDSLESALKIATNLDEGYLCIQGPPGTGKTYVGSKIIANLVEKGLELEWHQIVIRLSITYYSQLIKILMNNQ